MRPSPIQDITPHATWLFEMAKYDPSACALQSYGNEYTCNPNVEIKKLFYEIII